LFQGELGSPAPADLGLEKLNGLVLSRRGPLGPAPVSPHPVTSLEEARQGSQGGEEELGNVEGGGLVAQRRSGGRGETSTEFELRHCY